MIKIKNAFFYLRKKIFIKVLIIQPVLKASQLLRKPGRKLDRAYVEVIRTAQIYLFFFTMMLLLLESIVQSKNNVDQENGSYQCHTCKTLSGQVIHRLIPKSDIQKKGNVYPFRYGSLSSRIITEYTPVDPETRHITITSAAIIIVVFIFLSFLITK